MEPVSEGMTGATADEGRPGFGAAAAARGTMTGPSGLGVGVAGLATLEPGASVPVAVAASAMRLAGLGRRLADFFLAATGLVAPGAGGLAGTGTEGETPAFAAVAAACRPAWISPTGVAAGAMGSTGFGRTPALTALAGVFADLGRTFLASADAAPPLVLAGPVGLAAFLAVFFLEFMAGGGRRAGAALFGAA